jgi:hypothetical protein
MPPPPNQPSRRSKRLRRLFPGKSSQTSTVSPGSRKYRTRRVTCFFQHPLQSAAVCLQLGAIMGGPLGDLLRCADMVGLEVHHPQPCRRLEAAVHPTLEQHPVIAGRRAIVVTRVHQQRETILPQEVFAPADLLRQRAFQEADQLTGSTAAAC